MLTRRSLHAARPPSSPVQRVQHLDDDERRQRHGGRLVVRKDVAVDVSKAFVLHEALRLVRLWRRAHKSVSATTAYVTSTE